MLAKLNAVAAWVLAWVCGAVYGKLLGRLGGLEAYCEVGAVQRFGMTCLRLTALCGSMVVVL